MLNTYFGVIVQQKQRCVALEEQLVELVLAAMERSEGEVAIVETSPTEENTAGVASTSHWLWLHLSSQLIYFVLFQFASFPNIVMALHDKVR
jgi:mediator of RNA polymerase II transcription subunit 23